jgi:putative endonuclease
MHIYYVYIIECSDGTLYVGVTNNVARRFHEHCEGIDPKSYTAKRRPLKLVHVETFQWVLDAIAREKQLKGWSAPKKRALMMGEEEALHVLAKCRNSTAHDRPDRDRTTA